MAPEAEICVLTPVFNGEDKIAAYRKTLDAQTLQPSSIVIYDDGSTDSTWELLCQWADEDARVSPYRGDENKGRGFGRQRLTELATGEFVAWLDIDDQWHPDKLRSQAVAHKAVSETFGTAFILCSPYILIDAETGRHRLVQLNATYEAVDYLTLGRSQSPVVPLQATFGRTAAFQAIGFDPKLNWAEDFDFFLRFLCNGGKLVPHQTDVAPTVYYYNPVGQAITGIAAAHDHIYRKNAHLWPNPTEADEEKYVRRMRYVLNLCAVNRAGALAETLLEECIQNLDSERFGDDIRRGWKQVMHAYEGDPSNYIRISHMLANSTKKLRCNRVEGGYVAGTKGDAKIQWRTTTGDSSEVVHRGEQLQDDVIVRLFVEGIREIELRELSNGITRKFVIDTLPGGMITLVPPVNL